MNHRHTGSLQEQTAAISLTLTLVAFIGSFIAGCHAGRAHNGPDGAVNDGNLEDGANQDGSTACQTGDVRCSHEGVRQRCTDHTWHDAPCDSGEFCRAQGICVPLRPFGAPVLLFSDLTSGPANGIEDGLGQGVIVTVWGTNLGQSQQDSTISVGGKPVAHVYYWGDADGSTGAGPADLFTSHRIQTISFSVPAAAGENTVDIQVTVGGHTSNSLPFTVRSGHIYFVKTSGSDETGDGSWGHPWASLDYVAAHLAGGALGAGDTVYACDGIDAPDTLGVGFADRSVDGTEERPIWITAYPGARVVLEDGLGNYNRDMEGWCFSKLVVMVKTRQGAITGFKYMRAVGNEITNSPGSCANGQSGAIATGAAGSGRDVVSKIRIFGNYIHDFGCDSTSKLEHVFYFTNRSGVMDEPYEIGWNNLRDNKAHGGLHNYDEGVCGDFSGTIRIHDNVVVNQVGPCADFSSGGSTDPCFSMNVEFYNNVLVNCGLEVPACENGGGHTMAVSFGGANNHAHIKFYNNTIFGYGAGDPPGSGYGLGASFAGTLEWVNNIVVDTQNLPFTNPRMTQADAPTFAAGNLWYDGGDGIPATAPTWDSNPIMTDPLFVDSAAEDFRLHSESPAVDSGSDHVAGTVTQDLEGMLGSKVFVETDAEKAAEAMYQVISDKRQGLGL